MMPHVYSSNHFHGQTIELGGAIWRANTFQGCRLTVNRPPVEFNGNTVDGCAIELGPELEASIRFFGALAGMAPEFAGELRRRLGLDDPGVAGNSPSH